MPEAWTDRTGGDSGGPFLIAASQDREDVPRDRCVASVNLVVEPCDDPLHERSAAVVAEQSSRLPGYVLLDLEHVSLVGHAAVRSLFTFPLDPFQIVVDQWLIVERGWAWCLSGGTDTIGFPQDAPVLEAIAATLELPREGPSRDAIEEPRAADGQAALDTETDLTTRALLGAASDLLALSDEAAGMEVPAARTAAARAALAESAAPASDELVALLDELLDPVREHARTLELQVDDDLVLGWIAGDTATLLAPEGDDLALLRRVPTVALPGAVVGHIPSVPAASGRASEALEMPPGVLAGVVATRTLPVSIMPGAARDGLLALTRALQAWWRLEIRDRHREAPARILEGFHADDGPWSLVSHDDMVRVEPSRPRDLFRTLCRELSTTDGACGPSSPATRPPDAGDLAPESS